MSDASVYVWQGSSSNTNRAQCVVTHTDNARVSIARCGRLFGHHIRRHRSSNTAAGQQATHRGVPVYDIHVTAIANIRGTLVPQNGPLDVPYISLKYQLINMTVAQFSISLRSEVSQKNDTALNGGETNLKLVLICFKIKLIVFAVLYRTK